ncbi:hypothetical protein NQZ79_g135 [Umbelopsis isabellina]|nr:hypothetical protein NQZ79_g135 [Umbelopsis isabellina]
MGYCTRCGDLNTATRCKRCNGPVMARTLHRAGEGTTTENVDRWKSRYLDNDGSALFRAPSVLSTANKPAVKNVNYLKQLQRSTSNVVRPLVTQTKSFISLVPVPSSWVDTKGGDMCTKCDQEIADQGVALASGASYHKECLQCQKCDQVLDNPSFMSANNKFYHNEVRLF